MAEIPLIEAIGREQMRDVLWHEVAHIRRRDPLIVPVQELARALYWPGEASTGISVP